jgi:hypothetical protein
VQRAFYLEDGRLLTGSEQVDPGSRKTVYLNHEMGDIGGAAAYFSSSDPFIAERSIYWGANGWIEGTNVIGSTVLAAEWHMPEGTESDTWDTFLLLLNPTAAAVSVDVTVFIEDLGAFTAPVDMRPVIAAQTRKTINMRDFLTQMEQAGGFSPGTLADRSFSTRVRAIGGEGIVVEHAL